MDVAGLALGRRRCLETIQRSGRVPTSIQMSAPEPAVKTYLQARKNRLKGEPWHAHLEESEGQPWHWESEGQPWHAHLAGDPPGSSSQAGPQEGRIETTKLNTEGGREHRELRDPAVSQSDGTDTGDC